MLLLRTAIGLVSAWQGATLVTGAGGGWLETVAGVTAIAAAAALIVGLFTPCAAALVAIGAAASADGLVLIDAVSLVLLGPGAFSIDARLFGRREIHIREPYRAPPD